jgi:hypothetical protein
LYTKKVFEIRFNGQLEGEFDVEPLVVIDEKLTNRDTVFVAGKTKGANALKGDFTVLFRGEETTKLDVGATNVENLDRS